jgi:hypothetical protein
LGEVFFGFQLFYKGFFLLKGVFGKHAFRSIVAILFKQKMISYQTKPYKNNIKNILQQ